MKICIYGAGAVGGHLAVRLLNQGSHEVSVIARNDQLRAIVQRGLTLLADGEAIHARPHHATDSPETLPPQDVVFVSLKAPAQPAEARRIAHLLGPGGCAVFACNGIPWWWAYRGPQASGRSLPLLDPDGSLWREPGPERAVGCVIYSGNEVVEPGVIRHTSGNRWLLGEPAGPVAPRTARIASAMNEAGLRTECVDDIRAGIWQKLLRNAPLNTLCALTRLPVGGLAREPGLLALWNDVIDEVVAIAAACGTDLSGVVDETRPRALAPDSPPTHPSVRPSMLQDAIAGRQMEVAAILGQVQAFGRETATPSPRIDLLTTLLGGLDRAVRSGA